MARPGIIIGLGGTGQWVLTFLKKELLEIGGGRMPSGVKLLAFDTTSQTTAKSGQSQAQKSDEDMVRAGAVELTEGIEFIPIGDNVMRLATEIADGKHPHLQWYPAKSFLGKLPPAAFATKEGSGQIRQMGRISVFRDLAAIRNSEILSRLRSAIQDLQKEVTRDSQLEVIIIGSLAGGTGAGMLVDMALLVRAQAAQLVQNNYIVRGLFVLPRAFTKGGLGQDRDMLARSFATWRELDRFMIVSERFGLRQINYHARHQDLRIQINKRAYDVSYLIDPARQSVNSLENEKNEEGLYPALAHCISAILDDKAGKAYTEFVSTNLAGKLAQLPRNPYHSAIGSYTLKVPVYYAHEKFSHQLAMDVLERFLAPEKNDKGIVVRVSEMRNREVAQGYAGWQAVRNFMSSSGLNIDGQEIPNTALMPLIAEVRDQDGQTDAAVSNRWAQGGLSRSGHPVVRGLTEISQDDAGKRIQQDINEELNLLIYKVLPPSRQVGDTPAQAFTRITKRVPDIRHEHYGIDDLAGERLRGKYGEALEQAKKAQLERFVRLVSAWTANALNGQNPDPLIARTGKIGYVRAFFDELAKTCDYFVGFLNKVRQQRKEVLKIDARAKDAAGRAQRQYSSTRNKRCWFTFWDNFIHPDAHAAQRNYLRAEQNSIDVRKDDILLDVLAETVLEMERFAEQTRDEVDNWISHLARTGPNTTSLYSVAEESLNNVKVNHAIDQRMGKVSELIGEHEYTTDETFITDALKSLVWQVRPGNNRVHIDCGVEIPSDDPEKPPQYEPFRREGESPSRYNLRMILSLAERPYHTLHRERPLAREVMKVYDTGEKLATSLNKKAEPFYVPATNMQDSAQVISCYIRVNSNIDDKTKEYFDAFEAHMGALNTNLKGSSLTLVDSEDPHKLTVIRSDDLLPSSAFEMWEACREAYIRQVTDPYRGIPAAELHIFPAEINACYYEAEMPRLLRQDYRTLHPEVVALLEDREKFEMFFRAKALGFVSLAESKDNSYWTYQLPDDKEPLFITIPSASLDSRGDEDIFQVIHNFVLEGRDQRPGVGNALLVDWDKLRQAILNEQRNLGATAAGRKYRQEQNKGIVKDIEDEIERRRARVTDPAMRQLVGQEHKDLADVARVIYEKAAESLKR